MNKVNNILWVDWGSKYIWLAYISDGTTVINPIWSLMNDGNLFFSIWDVLTRYKIKKIIIGYPKNEEEIQKKIDNFIEQLKFIVLDEVKIEKIDEDYTSIEAWAVTWDFKKNEAEDTLSAIKILERWRKTI